MQILTWVGEGVDRLACCDVVVRVAVVVVEGSAVEDDFEVAEPEDAPEFEVAEPEDAAVVVELSTGGVVIGEPLPSVVDAMQYHSPAFRLAQSMPVFQAERLAAGTPIMASKSSQLLFYKSCQLDLSHSLSRDPELT